MQKKNTGTLYMIPVPLAQGALHTLPLAIREQVTTLKHFFVENTREARRFLKLVNKEINIDELSFCETNRNTVPDTTLLRKWLQEGHDVGVVSDAGCPGIADPGSELARVAHQIGANVVPFTGPSSILLALMASGMNGQSFCFNGYLPVKDPERTRKIKSLEQTSGRDKQTQIFIETPYRNVPLFRDLIEKCTPTTLLCIGSNITAPDEWIKTKTIREWAKEALPDIDKKPAIFLMLASE